MTPTRGRNGKTRQTAGAHRALSQGICGAAYRANQERRRALAEALEGWRAHRAAQPRQRPALQRQQHPPPHGRGCGSRLFRFPLGHLRTRSRRPAGRSAKEERGNPNPVLQDPSPGCGDRREGQARQGQERRSGLPARETGPALSPASIPSSMWSRPATSSRNPSRIPGKTWKAHQQAEAVIKASGVSVNHVQGDRAYYSLGSDQVVLPEKTQFPIQ